MRFKAVTLGFVLAGTALGSAGLTLGRARGAAWIGQPLELLVPVQLDPGQTESALCAEADVFHGDSRQDSSRIQVLAVPAEQAEAFNLKISSTALVDEPVVTIYLRAGCSQKSSRKYVLLADFPGESAAPLSRTPTPLAAQVPLAIPVQAALPSPVPAQPVTALEEMPKANTQRPKPSLPTAPVAPKAVAKELPKAVLPKKEIVARPEKPIETAKTNSSGKPRLRLDPLDTLNERVKALESTTTATTVQDDLARDAQRTQMLQSDLKLLLDQAVRNEASLLAMRERLEKAESERVPVALVYGLGALVVLCLGALAFLWTRLSRQPVFENSALHGQMTTGASSAANASVTPRQNANPHQDIHVDLVDLDDDAFDRLMGQPAQKAKN